jgi:hypothetical protein
MEALRTTAIVSTSRISRGHANGILYIGVDRVPT